MIELFRKIIKNKMIVLGVCIILICALYFIAREIIDNYEMGVFESETGEILEDSEEILGDVINKDSGKEGSEVSDGDMVNSGAEIENDTEVDAEESVTEIFVHVAGEVNNPGVVALADGARIVDAINVAGGTTPNADISDINLAYVLKDGMKVNVPNKEDVEDDSDYAYVIDGSGNGYSEVSSSDSEGDLDEVLSVNINTATQTELESLPGIGPSIAFKIIKYREEHGKFSSIDELKNVSGIGAAKFEALKDFVVSF